MVKVLILLLSVTGGLGLAVQASVNGGLGKKIGAIEASLVSFFIGTLILAIFAIFIGGGNVLNAFSVPKWQLTGGLLGAVFVTCIIFSVPRIGAASAVTGTIMGQMVMSMVIDHYGFFGTPRIPFDVYRLAGILLMALGLALIFKNSLSA